MSKNVQQTLSRSVLAILKPLVRILLRNGIAYGSFAELAKKVYVDVAFEDFAPDGKKQSISHVSAMTGLTRKEAKRLHELEQTGQSDSEQRYNRAIRVISGWLNDAEFHNKRGKPARLPLEGEKASFASLVKKYSGDITPKAMLSVLHAAHSVETTADKVRLIAHAYVPGNDPIDKITILGTDTAELIATIDYNLVNADNALRFQRKVSSKYVHVDAIPRFQALAAKRSQVLLEKFDAWLTEYEIDPDDPDSDQGRYVSLGIYYYENSSDKEDPS